MKYFFQVVFVFGMFGRGVGEEGHALFRVLLGGDEFHLTPRQSGLGLGHVDDLDFGPGLG